jgi:two-component system nitrogen regulation response regulator GlnG
LENICHWLTVMAPAQIIDIKDLPPDLVPRALAEAVAERPPLPPAEPARGAAEGSEAPKATSAEPGARGEARWLADLEGEARQRLEAGQPDVWNSLTREFEACLIRTALGLTRGRRIEAAQKLGIGRNTITRKIQELGLDD